MIQAQEHLLKSYVAGDDESSNLDYLYQIYLSTSKQAGKLYLTISSSSIIIGQKNIDSKDNIKINKDDFIGYNQQLTNVTHSINDETVYLKLTLNAFKKKKKFLRTEKRYLQRYIIYLKKQIYSDKQLKELKNTLLFLATNRKLINEVKPVLRLMIYFNPNAGSNSRKHLDNVIDFIGNTNLHFDVLETKKRHHCVEHINEQLKFQDYSGVVIISGDGLMHEFVNSKAVGILPVTHVPAGSGNAFAKYQTVLAGEACEDYESIYLAVKGKTKNLNLSEYNLENIQRPIYSFLSFEWCIMADLDMNSEFLRFLGGFRFEVYAAWRLISIRRYKGKFSYSLTSTQLPALQAPINDQPEFNHQQQTYFHQMIANIPWVSDKYQIHPLIKLEDEAMDMQTMKQSSGRWQLIKYLLNSESGSHFNREKQRQADGYIFDWAKIKSFRLQPNGDDRGVFGIDGQKYDSQKIQGKISNKKVLTFA